MKRGLNSTFNVVLLSAKIELSYRVRPTLTPERSPRLRAEHPAIVQSDQSIIDNSHPHTKPSTLHTENQKVLHHMAQSSRSPIGVNLFWETGANPPVEWQPWLATFKMAVMAQHNIDRRNKTRVTASKYCSKWSDQ